MLPSLNILPMFSINTFKTEKSVGQLLFFLDGHVSHMSYHLSSFCKEHLLQPLDVSFFAPLKKHWQKFLKTWRINHDGIDIQKFDVPTALSEIIKKEDFIATFTAGFKCCGLYPFNPNGINYDTFVKQSITFNHDKSEPNVDKSLLENEQAFKYLEKKSIAIFYKNSRHKKIIIYRGLAKLNILLYLILGARFTMIFIAKIQLRMKLFKLMIPQICFEKTDDILNGTYVQNCGLNNILLILYNNLMNY